jgi:hypothetical protein
MTTTDCAKCGREGGEVTLNAGGNWVDANGITWHEQPNGDSFCKRCEEKRKAQSDAAKLLGSLSRGVPKNFSAEDIERRRAQMRLIGLETQARRRALVASIVAAYKDTPAPEPIPVLEASEAPKDGRVDLPEEVAAAVAEEASNVI